jgi:hypothetical protein
MLQSSCDFKEGVGFHTDAVADRDSVDHLL